MIYMRLQNSQRSDLVIYSAKPSYNIMATKISSKSFYANSWTLPA